MAYANYRTIIRVDCTPISDTKGIPNKIRDIDGFHDKFSEFNSFKIGETSNYRKGELKEMEPEELVYRYYKNTDGIEYVFDLSSRFYYIRLSGENLPSDWAPYFNIIEDVTRILHTADKFVSIVRYGVGKMFKESKERADATEVDKIERDAYISRPENVKIVCIREDKTDSINLNIVEYVDDISKKVDYGAGQKLYDKAFMDAQTKAEEKYGC